MPADGRPAVEAKRALARGLVERFHGARAAAAAEGRFDRLHVERSVPDQVEEAALPGEDPIFMPALIASHFGLSRSEARRLIAQGGVRIDGEPLGEGDLEVPAARLDGAVLQLGRRRFKRFRAAGSQPARAGSHAGEKDAHAAAPPGQ